MSRWRVLLLALVAGCGVDVLELTSRRVPTEVEVLVVGDVPQADLDTFSTSASERRDDKQLSLSEPADGAVLPANIAPVRVSIQRDKPGKMMPMDGSYELSLSVGSSELRIYTRDTFVDVPADRWRALLGQGDVLTLRARVVMPGPKRELVATAERSLRIAPSLGAGSLYFESGSELARARIDETSAVVLGGPDSPVRCGTGHAVSRDGTRLGTACADVAGAVWSLPDLSVLASLPARADSTSFGAFDPTGARFVRESAGQLELVDSQTGQVLSALTGTAGARWSSPDWSPDGQSLLFVQTLPLSMPMPMGAALGSSLVRLRRSVDAQGQERFVEPETVVAADPKLTLAAPSYSPDGRLIAYESRTNKPEDVTLMIVAADGATPRRVLSGPADLRARAAPTWWPSSEPNHAYLVYSASAEPMMGAVQLWLSDVLADDEEPRVAPALRLPFQSLTMDNRRALFARDR